MNCVNQKLNYFLHLKHNGFTRGTSCETQLCTTFHELVRTAEAKRTAHAVTLNFKKVFNKVPHALLMQKLKLMCDMHSHLVNWVHIFEE